MSLEEIIRFANCTPFIIAFSIVEVLILIRVLIWLAERPFMKWAGGLDSSSKVFILGSGAHKILCYFGVGKVSSIMKVAIAVMKFGTAGLAILLFWMIYFYEVPSLLITVPFAFFSSAISTYLTVRRDARRRRFSGNCEIATTGILPQGIHS